MFGGGGGGGGESRFLSDSSSSSPRRMGPKGVEGLSIKDHRYKFFLSRKA